jgi:hypothetical protein
LPGFRLFFFVNAFLAVTSHFSTYRHFFVSLSPAILGFSFRALREKASFVSNDLSRHCLNSNSHNKNMPLQKNQHSDKDEEIRLSQPSSPAATSRCPVT